MFLTVASWILFLTSFFHFASIILILTWISGKNWRWWISSNGIKLKCEARETKSRQKQFTPLYSPGISVFCAPWENWAKLLALGKCKKKIQGNRRKISFPVKIFSEKSSKFLFWRKMYVDNAVKSTWASHFYDHR